jgi:23S rRNA pseudouridine2605 synthase
MFRCPDDVLIDLNGCAAAGGAAGGGVGAGRGDPDAAVRARDDAHGELRRRGGGGHGAHLGPAERAGAEGRQGRGAGGGAGAGAGGGHRGERHRRRPPLARLRPHARGDPRHRVRHRQPHPARRVLPPGRRRPHRQGVPRVARGRAVTGSTRVGRVSACERSKMSLQAVDYTCLCVGIM